jgi:hypothetical protein
MSQQYLVDWIGSESTVLAGGPQLRNAEDYIVPYSRTDHLRRLPLITAPETWNYHL